MASSTRRKRSAKKSKAIPHKWRRPSIGGSRGILERPKVTVEVKPLGDLYGWCNEWTGEILADPDQTALEFMGTIIHERLHIALPRTSEHEIERLERAVTRVLWKMGYRLDESKARR